MAKVPRSLTNRIRCYRGPSLTVAIALYTGSAGYSAMTCCSSFVLTASQRSLNSSRFHPLSAAAEVKDSSKSQDEDMSSTGEEEECQEESSTTTALSVPVGRRTALITAAASAATLIPLAANSASPATTTIASSSSFKSLEDLALGKGLWRRVSDNPNSPAGQSRVPAYFATYAARFLINYDEGMASWWSQKNRALTLLADEQRQAKQGKAFGSLARSIQIAVDGFLEQQLHNHRGSRDTYGDLLQMFLATYGNGRNNNSLSCEETRRQVGLLFSMLPLRDQPSAALSQFATVPTSATTVETESAQTYQPHDPGPMILSKDLSALLPSEYRVVSVKGIGNANAKTIDPPISLFEVGFDEEFGQTAVATPFGPLSSKPLVRETPTYTPSIYGLFGLSGATGCALTHCVVIPLDVVKTRAQTDPDDFSDLLEGTGKILQRDGIQGLLLGAQATLAGYFWYGLSVYPCYTFFKRWFTQTVLPPEVAMVHVNDIALVAGAFAAVVASLGLTPLEAARIRVVAEPEKYRPMGLSGTLAAIAGEDKKLGWQGLYAGLPSLMSRQVIFGSIKFLAFERASEAIFMAAPSLRDATWTSLAVSLVAGGLSGAISSVVSQPADSVLTYVSQNSRGTSSMGVIEGCRIMIAEDGVGSLFRGLSSRCVWAAAIIAGQFLLYDVFRTIFGVSSEDLSQVYQVVLK